jgi:hypothetical protein
MIEYIEVLCPEGHSFELEEKRTSIAESGRTLYYGNEMSTEI